MSLTPPLMPGAIPPPSEPPRTPLTAILALVTGLVGPFLCGVPSFVAVVLGLVALKKIGRSNGALEGRGLAVAGLVLGGIGILLVPLLAGLAIPLVGRAKTTAQDAKTFSDMRQITLAVQLYATDHEGRLTGSASDLEAAGILKGNFAVVWSNVTWVATPGTKVDELAPKDVVVRYERTKPRLVIVGYADGSVDQLEPKRAARTAP